MASRPLSFLWGIYSLVLAVGGFVMLAIAAPGAPAWAWLALLALAAWGAWDIYRAFAGRGSDAAVAADLERRIAALGGTDTTTSGGPRAPTDGPPP